MLRNRHYSVLSSFGTSSVAKNSARAKPIVYQLSIEFGMDLNEARKKGEIKVIALLYVPSIGRTIENVRRSKFSKQDFLIREEAEGLKLDGDFVLFR